jgi:cytochrome c oxidase subunit 4
MNLHSEGVRLWVKPSGVWLALLVLLAITVSSAYVPLGAFNGVINLGVAGIKAALVVIFFMHLNRSSALLRLAAAAGLFWLTFLFALSFGDYATRSWSPDILPSQPPADVGLRAPDRNSVNRGRNLPPQKIEQ